MSKTYRRAKGKDSYMLTGPHGVLWAWEDFGKRRRVDRNSDEGKKLISQFHSDQGFGWMNFRGPSWFYTMFSQVPYRARARAEIVKWTRNPDYEICLEDKPHREYWL